MKKTLIALTLLTLVGCATVPTWTPELKAAVDRETAQKCKPLPTSVARISCQIEVANYFANREGIPLTQYDWMVQAKMVEIAEKVDSGVLTPAQAMVAHQEYLYQLQQSARQQALAERQASRQASSALMATGAMLMMGAQPRPSFNCQTTYNTMMPFPTANTHCY